MLNLFHKVTTFVQSHIRPQMQLSKKQSALQSIGSINQSDPPPGRNGKIVTANTQPKITTLSDQTQQHKETVMSAYTTGDKNNSSGNLLMRMERTTSHEKVFSWETVMSAYTTRNENHFSEESLMRMERTASHEKVLAFSGEKSREETLPPLEVYFHLELCSDRASARASSQATIGQGQSYDVIVYASSNSALGGDATKLTVKSDIVLLLECFVSGDPQSSIIENPCYNMTYQQIKLEEDILDDQDHKPFHIRVPKRFPRECVFQLSYRKVNSSASFRPITKLPMKIEGSYDPNYQNLQIDCHLDITTQLPQNAAILYVTQTHKEQLHMICGHRGTLLTVDTLPDWTAPPRLADFAERAKLSFTERSQRSTEPVKEIVEEIIKKLRNFSKCVPGELRKWIRELSQDSCGPISVIIVDNTSLEIPWEILEFDNEAYFGAHITIARWFRIHSFNHVILNVQDSQHQGSVHAYLDGELGKQQTYAEYQALKNLQASIHRLRELPNLLKSREQLKHVGLIYIGCHGKDGTTLGSQHPDQFTYIDLQIAVNHPGPRPVVFANACDSARLEQNNGLRHVFLDLFASSYIGTLGQVISTYASKIASCILQHISTIGSEGNGIQIADTLRILRADVAKMVATNKIDGNRSNNSYTILGQEKKITEEEKYFYFLTVFMYVYYGNPLARLKLVRPQTRGD